MKTGRNAPCPCGSGKKYKQCCFSENGMAQSIMDEIAEAAEAQPLESPEELNAFAQQQMYQRNHKPLDEFCGLSPEQMYHLLYAPFSSPETILFTDDLGLSQDSRIMRMCIPLLEAIGESGLKATATGNLPLKFCKALAAQFRQEDKHTRRFFVGGISSEKDFEELHCTRLVAQMAGLIRKYRGKFVLTRKCRELLATQAIGQLYFELFKTYTTKFNWGYRDAYPEAQIIQQSCCYTLYLLASFGDAQHTQQFFADKFLTAFPMALDIFQEDMYSTAEDTASHCYFVRALDRFAAFFGLAEFELKPRKAYSDPYLVRKSALLDCFVVFKTQYQTSH
jgi:hypothetical protein